MDINDLMQVLTLVAVVAAFYWQYRSFPPTETAKLIEQLTEMAMRTESRLDDAIVDILEYFNDVRLDVDEASNEDDAQV